MNERIRVRIGTVLNDNGVDILSEDGGSLLHSLYRVIEQELDRAREEGFDDGVKRTVDVVQKGLDELLLERGEDKYWVGDILRGCNSSVEKLLPESMKHYLSKLTTK